MNKPDNQKTVAYLDGELALEEVAAFEKELPQETIESLQGEVALDMRIAERLSGPECPEELWRNLKQKMQTEKSPARILRFPRKRWLWLPLAASLTLVAGVHFAHADHSFLERVSTVADLRSEVVSENPDDVLSENGFGLVVHAASKGGHKVEVLGGYTEKLAGEPVAVVCINCCGKPIRVLITRRGGRAAKALLRTRNYKNLKTVAWRGDFQLAIISEHPAEDMLNFFEEV